MPICGKNVCLLCNRNALKEFPESIRLKAVTSDCKEWADGGLIAVCMHCGHIQKKMGHTWEKSVGQVYNDYEVYHLSEGREQVVFPDDSISACPRSVQILKHLENRVGIPGRGALLDVGCGNGELLRTFNRRHPEWVLYGYEQNDINRETVLRVPAVKHFFSERLEDIDHKFDLITLLHVLEHIAVPSLLLAKLHKNLTSEGALLVHVPNSFYNPFDLTVIDHCSHFMLSKLVQVAKDSGFAVLRADTDWVYGYVTVVLGCVKGKVKESNEIDIDKIDPDDVSRTVGANIEWLGNLLRDAARIGANSEMGIFGTAIAGTWLASAVGPSARFFVDEDTMRVGKKHLGRRVLHPLDVPPRCPVYLASPPSAIERIYNRLRKLYPSLKVIMPPPVAG